MKLQRGVTNSVLLSLCICLVGFIHLPGHAESRMNINLEDLQRMQTELAAELARLDAALATAMEEQSDQIVTVLQEPTAKKVGFSKFDALIAGLSIFVLAVFVGFEVITKVPPTLHTPLMSGSNAISGITIVGALLVAGRNDYASLLGVLAVVFAMINVIGGFWVTHRMLSMFKR